MPSAKPGQPPKADMSVLVKRVDELSVKAGLGNLPPGATKLPLWKRWVGGDPPEYDTTGLRDVVKTNAEYLDAVKGDLDTFRQSQGVKNTAQDAEIAALKEAVAHPPFPG